MDMRQYAGGDNKLKRLTEAIRRNKDILAHVFAALTEEIPDASRAQECFEEMDHEDQTSIWGVSTSAGGIFERWERDALKHGCLDLTDAYEVWCRRSAIPYPGGLVTSAERRKSAKETRKNEGRI